MVEKGDAESDVIYLRLDGVRQIIDVMLADPDGGRLSALLMASSFVDPDARADMLAYVDKRLGELAR